MRNAVVEIRQERPEDYAEIQRVVRRAFDGREQESALIELLRERNETKVALVAIAERKVVGHIMFSAVQIANAPEGCRALGLAPLSVLPELQNNGIGSKLSRAGLEWCKAHGYDIVVVLGDPHYYARFGFAKARDFNLDNEYHEDDAFMAMELRDGALTAVSGLVKYSSAFVDSDC